MFRFRLFLLYAISRLLAPKSPRTRNCPQLQMTRKIYHCRRHMCPT